MTSYVITYRLVKGVPINEVEYDGTIHNLDDRIAALELTPLGRGIASINPDGSGSYLIITYTDSTQEAPIKMPVARYRSTGPWQPMFVYQIDDTFWINGAVYPVTYPHTSGGSFDPGGNSGSGLDWYGQPLFEAPANSLPPGGDAGQVLARMSGPDYLVQWVDAKSGLPTGMFNGAILGWQSGVAYWRNVPLTYLQFQIPLLDLLANRTQYLRAPFAGRVYAMQVTCQQACDVGGTIDLEVVATPTGIAVTIPDSFAPGDYVESALSGDVPGYHFNQGYLMTLLLAGFSESPPMINGCLNVVLVCKQD